MATEGKLTSTKATADADDSYDPHDDRHAESPVSNNATLMHLIKGALGTGILAMPYSFTLTGWLLGLLMTFFVTFICSHCILRLIASQYVLCKRYRIPTLTYAHSARLALETGPEPLRSLALIASPVVDTLLILYQLGICAVYVVFIGSSLRSLIAPDGIDERWYYVALLVPFLLVLSIRNLKQLVPFSAFANVMMALGLGIVLYYVFSDMSHIGDRELAKSIVGLPQFFSICLFALEAIGVIVSVEASMATPKSFRGITGVFSQSMMLVGALYAFLGMVGYWRYGNDVSGSITFNLDDSHVLAKICKICLILAVFISYGLQGYVIVDIVWLQKLKVRVLGNKRECWYEYMVRYSIVVASVILAVIVPNLGLLIGIIGALCLSLLGFVVPALMDICVRHPDAHGRCLVVLIGNLLVIVFGLFILVVGLFFNIRDLIDKY